MENTSLVYDYGHYDDILDFPVDCDDNTCVSVEPLRVASLLLRARLCQSLPATCRWALKNSWSKDDSVVSKKSTSHDLVSEMQV